MRAKKITVINSFSSHSYLIFFCYMKEIFSGRWSLDPTMRGAHIYMVAVVTYDMLLCDALFHGNKERETSTKAFLLLHK